MKTTVIVPTYLRQRDLARCLTALTQQQTPADEVIVVVRDRDTDTHHFLQTDAPSTLPLKVVVVSVPGVVAAMNAGLNAASGDIVAFTDDDAAPHVDWLTRIVAHFASDQRIGGVGGRDAIQRPEPWFHGDRLVVGRLQWYGRMIGEHHRGVGAAREVDFLKGVNMSFRRQAIGDLRFDSRLLGSGAQVHFEVAFCLALKRQGWRLIYDPAIVVDHHLAMRFDEDQRDQFNETAFFNEVYNETLALLDHLSLLQRVAFACWSVLIGSRRAYGLAQWARFAPTNGRLAWRKWWVTLKGRSQAWFYWQRQTPPPDAYPNLQLRG